MRYGVLGIRYGYPEQIIRKRPNYNGELEKRLNVTGTITEVIRIRQLVRHSHGIRMLEKGLCRLGMEWAALERKRRAGHRKSW